MIFVIGIIIIILLFLIWRSIEAPGRAGIRVAKLNSMIIEEVRRRRPRIQEGLELETFQEAYLKAHQNEIISKCCNAPVNAKKKLRDDISQDHWFVCKKCNEECAVINASINTDSGQKSLEFETYYEAQLKAYRNEIISKCCKAPVNAKKQIIALNLSTIRKGGHWFVCKKCKKECAVINGSTNTDSGQSDHIEQPRGRG